MREIFKNENLSLYVTAKDYSTNMYKVQYFEFDFATLIKYKDFKKLGNAINYIQKNEDLSLEQTLQLIKLKKEYETRKL